MHITNIIDKKNYLNNAEFSELEDFIIGYNPLSDVPIITTEFVTGPFIDDKQVVLKMGLDDAKTHLELLKEIIQSAERNIEKFNERGFEMKTKSQQTTCSICKICGGVSYDPNLKEFIDNHYACGVKNYTKKIKISRKGVEVYYQR